MDQRSTTELLADPDYYSDMIATIPNIRLSYQDSDGNRRVRCVGIRWFRPGDGNAAAVVRLVADNCGLEHEFPVREIIVPQAHWPPSSVMQADRYLCCLEHRQGNAVAEIAGDALRIHFRIDGSLIGGFDLTLDVRRPDHDRRPWSDILDNTPCISEYTPPKHYESERSMMHLRALGRPEAELWG